MMKQLLIMLLMIGVLIGTPKLANCSVYSRVRGCGNTTKDWTIKYAGVTKNKTVEYFNISKDWTIWTIKHSITVKDGVICYVSSKEFYDMLYLAGDGFTFGMIFDDDRCTDILIQYPVVGRIVAISSRIIAVVIVSYGVEKIIYYVIRHFAAGGVYTSQGIDGVVNYVGQTNNFTRRGVEWARVGRVIIPVYKTPFLCERRAVEQMLINRYGITNLVNKIHSIRKLK